MVCAETTHGHFSGEHHAVPTASKPDFEAITGTEQVAAVVYLSIFRRGSDVSMSMLAASVRRKRLFATAAVAAVLYTVAVLGRRGAPFGGFMSTMRGQFAPKRSCGSWRALGAARVGLKLTLVCQLHTIVESVRDLRRQG